MRSLVWLVVLLGLLVCTPRADAAEYFTDKDSIGGGCSDSNPGTRTQPVCTIDAGIRKLAGGDTLWIRAGDYAEDIWPSNDNRFGHAWVPAGTSESNRTIISGYGNERPQIRRVNFDFNQSPPSSQTSWFTLRQIYIDGTRLGPKGGGQPNCADIMHGHHNRLQNVWLIDCPSMCTRIEGEYQDILDSRLEGSFWYGTYYSGSHGRIDNNVFANNGGYGVHMYLLGQACPSSDCVHDNVVSNNRVYGNGRGPDAAQGAGGLLISRGANHVAYNNLVYNNAFGLSMDHQCVNCAFYNNTSYGNDGYGLQVSTVTNGGAIVRNNIVVGNGNDISIGNTSLVASYSNNLCGAGGGYTCTHSGDPQFTNAGGGDFSLQGGSAARNQGATISMVTTGYSGPPAFAPISRPQGPAYDIGAYEYQEGTQPFDFQVQYPGVQTIAQGGTRSFSASATVVSGTPVPVTFSVTSLPSGVSVSSITNSPCTPGCSATVTLQALAGATPGDYSPTLSAANGSQVRNSPGWTLSVTGTGGSFDYSVSDPGDRTVLQGQSIQVPVTITTLTGTPAAVTLSVTSTLPSGVSASWAGTPCTPSPNCTSTLTLTATPSAPVTPSPVTVTLHGAAGALTHDRTFPLTVAAQAPPQVGGNPIYVRCASASGGTSNDSFSCTEAEDPAKAKRTLSNALTECMNTIPGKILYLEGNGCTYVEEIDTLARPMLGGNGPSMTTNTRLEGYGSPVPIIQSPNPGGALLYLHNNDHYLTFKRLVFDGANHTFNLGVFLAGTHHVRLEEVELKNSLSGGFEGLYIENSANIELINTFVHHTGSHGITVDNGMDTLLCSGCHIFNATGKGLNVTNAGTKTNITIEQTEVRNNGGDGIDLNGGTGTLLQNLLVHSNGGRGVWVHGGASETRTLNSTVYGNTGVGLQCDTGATSTHVRNTIAYGNTGGNILNNCGATVAKNLCAALSAECAVFGDPLFVAAPGDLHLGNGSPGINAGELISSITVDYDGNPRQQDTQDIGAYERTQAAPVGPDVTVRQRDLARVGWYF